MQHELRVLGPRDERVDEAALQHVAEAAKNAAATGSIVEERIERERRETATTAAYIASVIISPCAKFTTPDHAEDGGQARAPSGRRPVPVSSPETTTFAMRQCWRSRRRAFPARVATARSEMRLTLPLYPASGRPSFASAALLGSTTVGLPLQVLEHDRAVAFDLALGVELDRPAEGDDRSSAMLVWRIASASAFGSVRLRALERVGGDQDRVEGVAGVDAVKHELVLRELLLERRRERLRDARSSGLNQSVFVMQYSACLPSALQNCSS